MAITIKGQPTYKVQPVYNPVNFYFDSNNKNQTGFRYIVDVKTGNTKLFTLKLMPDFDNGYGVTELSRMLSTYLSYDFNLTNSSFNASKSYLKYKLEIGEEWLEEWSFIDYNYIGSSTQGGLPSFNPNNRSNLTSLQGNTQPSFQPGDMINVNITSNPVNKPQLSGLQRVLEVRQISSKWYVILDLGWVGSGVADLGIVTYADGKKTQRLNDITIDNLCVWNGVFQTDKFPQYDMNYYAMIDAIDTQKEFLSNLPFEYTIRLDNKLMVLYNKYDEATNAPNKVVFTSDDGTIYHKSLTTTRGNWVNMVNIGADNSFGTLQSGTAPFIKPTTKSYTIRFFKSNNLGSSHTYKINIDRSCAWDENIQLMFMDKFGSFLPFNFTARNEEKHNINRDEYTKYLGGFEVDKFNYNTSDGGRNIYNSNYQRSLKLRTSYLNKNQLEVLKHLVESPKVFIKYEDVWQEVIIKNSSIDVIGNKYTQPNKFDIDIEFVNIDKINI